MLGHIELNIMSVAINSETSRTTQVPSVWIAVSLYTDKLMFIGPRNSISGSLKIWVYTVVGIKLTSAAVSMCAQR